MEQHPLAGLEPASVFHFFEEICRIPHGSRNTKAISDYLVAFAEERGLACRQDALNNVVIKKPGTPGYENHAPVILQGHMDMVCEKEPDCPINFETDGLDLTHDGTDIFARGTTLGGDDGIAVAYSLALLDAKDIPHPPLEVIVTVDEEIGMLGAADIDLSGLQGRTLVNLDSEDEGVLTVSCAGGATAFIDLPVARRTVYGPCVLLEVDGLQGGHSGVEIHKNRANANKVMGELLCRIQEKMPVCIVSLAGGAKDNAIPRSCRVNLVAMGLELDTISEIAAGLQAEARGTLTIRGPALCCDTPLPLGPSPSRAAPTPISRIWSTWPAVRRSWPGTFRRIWSTPRAPCRWSRGSTPASCLPWRRGSLLTRTSATRARRI